MWLLVWVCGLFCCHGNWALECNGMEELCDLNIKQVTLAGAHNAGAGFDGAMMIHIKYFPDIPLEKCPIRNQNKNFGEELDLGIRYFDVDVCWDRTQSPNQAWTCHADAYGGTIKKMLQQIDDWMNENPNEVIVIHFNRDADKPNIEKTGKDTAKQLMEKWGPQRTDGVKMVENNVFTPLRELIESNTRIYVIMYEDLLHHAETGVDYLIPEWQVGYTWTSKHGSSEGACRTLATEHMGDARCQNEARREFVRYDMYLSWGLCIWHLARVCRPYIDMGVEGCWQGTQKRHKTVNFIVVDYVDDKVVEAARKQNERNVVFFSPSTTMGGTAGIPKKDEKKKKQGERKTKRKMKRRNTHPKFKFE